MEWALLQLFLTVFIVPCISGELCVDTSATLIPAYGNKRIIAPDSVLWTVTLSMPMCLERCYQDPLCLSVNVSPDADTCVGFKKKFEGQTPNTEAAQGYRVYEMDKAGPLDCTTDDVCSTNFGPSHCHENLCRCDIGYSMDGLYCRNLTAGPLDCTADVVCSTNYGPSHCHENLCRCDIGYSMDGLYCRNLSDCSSFSSVISEYLGSLTLTGGSLNSFTDITISACKTNCLNEPLCQSADYDDVNSGLGTCWLNVNTWNDFDAADVDIGQADKYVFLQRECIW